MLEQVLAPIQPPGFQIPTKIAKVRIGLGGRGWIGWVGRRAKAAWVGMGAGLPKVQSAGRVDVYETVTRQYSNGSKLGCALAVTLNRRGLVSPRNSLLESTTRDQHFPIEFLQFQSHIFSPSSRLENMGG